MWEQGGKKGGQVYDLWDTEAFNLNTAVEQKKSQALALGRQLSKTISRPVAGTKTLNAVPAVEVRLVPMFRGFSESVCAKIVVLV